LPKTKSPLEYNMPTSEKTPSTTHHIIIIVMCTIILTGCFLFHVDETGLFLFGYKWPMRCFLKETIGLKCALCGISRSLCLTARGDFRTAASCHPLGPVIFAFILWQLPYRIFVLKGRQNSAVTRLSRTNVIVAIIIASGILVSWFVYLGRQVK
jgi:hypothetical protein